MPDETELTTIGELQPILKLTPKKGETRTAFSERLARKANDMAEDAWESLEQPTQVWVNSAIEALASSKAIPLPTGIDEVLPEEEEEAPAPAKKKAPTTKAAAGKPSKKAPVPAKGTSGGPKGKFSREDKIKVNVAANPFREGCKAHDWFGKIKDGATVDQAIAAGAPRHHIRWASALGHIKIG